MRYWIDIAKILSETETPNINLFYHGSSEGGNKLTLTKNGPMGDGVYLSNSADHAAKFGENILMVTLKRPINAVTTDEVSERNGRGLGGSELETWVADNGYDGVWRSVAENVWELICYDPAALVIKGHYLEEKKKRKKRRKPKSGVFYPFGLAYGYGVGTEGGCGGDGGGGE